MSARALIAKMVSTEGFPVDRRTLEAFVLDEVDQGKVEVFHYPPVVFTVDRAHGETHLYSDTAGTEFIRACSRFMHDVWTVTPHPRLTAPILNPRVAKLALRFGWRPEGTLSCGHTVYTIERPL